MKILVTRPIRDGEEIARRLAPMGHEALLAPLLAVRFFEGEPLDLAGVQAILVTSANGVRALARHTSDRDTAIFAVGPQSAEAARKEGFVRVRSADGDAMALAAATASWADPSGGLLLHAAGEEASDALCEILGAQGFAAKRQTLYRMEKLEQLPGDVAQAIRHGDVQAALFFSPLSAGLFAECAKKSGISTDRLTAICISPGTARALTDLAFAEIRVAAEPNQAALLACL